MKEVASSQIESAIQEMKKNYGRVLTNAIAGKLNGIDCGIKAIICEKAICYSLNDHRRDNVYFVGTDFCSISEVLQQVHGENCFCDYFFKKGDDPYKDLMISSGLSLYAMYARYTTTHYDNPYKNPSSKRGVLLSEMYDPESCEYATIEDIPELAKLKNCTFDSYTTDYFSYEDWENIINNKYCLVYKENGKIYTMLIYRLDGKKLYFHSAINLGTANYMYNMERRVFEEYWDKGIRTYYAWYDVTNKKAHKISSNYAVSCDTLYNAIYRFS